MTVRVLTDKCPQCDRPLMLDEGKAVVYCAPECGYSFSIANPSSSDERESLWNRASEWTEEVRADGLRYLRLEPRW